MLQKNVTFYVSKVAIIYFDYALYTISKTFEIYSMF